MLRSLFLISLVFLHYGQAGGVTFGKVKVGQNLGMPFCGPPGLEDCVGEGEGVTVGLVRLKKAARSCPIEQCEPSGPVKSIVTIEV